MKASGFQRKASDLKRLRPMVAYKFVLTYSIETRLLAKCARSNLSQRRLRTSLGLACVASVSVRSMSKERGTRVNCRAKIGASIRAGKGVGKEKKETLRPGGGGEKLHQPQPLPSALLFHGEGMTLRVRRRVKPAYNSKWREIWYGLVDN